MSQENEEIVRGARSVLRPLSERASRASRVFQLFTLRRGLVIRREDFLNRAEALEAASRR